MTKNNFQKILISGASLLTLTAIVSTYNACAKSGVNRSVANSSSATSITPPSNEGGATDVGPAQSKLSISLLSSEQIIQSALSVADVPIDNNIRNEYNARAALLASSYDLNGVNPPMWLGITNINSFVCQSLVTKEAALAAAQRKFFPTIDFTKAAAQVSNTAWLESANAMSALAWGRDIQMDEQTALLAARTEFLAGIAAANVNNVQQTRNMMMFMCTALMSTVESITLN